MNQETEIEMPPKRYIPPKGIVLQTKSPITVP